MHKRKKLFIKLLILVLIITLPVNSMVFSAGTSSYLEVWDDALKISYNNKDITFDAQPLLISIYNADTTYIPLRAISNLFNKNIDWNAETSTVIINDKPDPAVAALQSEIAVKTQTILQLQAKIVELQDGKTTSTPTKVSTLSDLQDQLNSDHYKYDDVRFKIALSGSSSNIKLRITVDLNKYRYEWDSLTDSERTDYVQDICDDIRYKYKRARIDGYIRDSSDNTRLMTFSTDSYGYIDTGSSTLSDLQDSLTSSYRYYFSNMYLSFKLTGDTGSLTYKINLDYDAYRTRWGELTNTQIENLMSKVYDYVYNRLSSPTVTGYFYDTSNGRNLAKYWKSSGSTRRFERYVN